jgi:hypothetical protein
MTGQPELIWENDLNVRFADKWKRETHLSVLKS